MLWRPKLNQRPNLSFGIRTIRISTSDSIHVTFRSSVIIGGEDHKTGQEEETESRYERLKKP